MSHQLLKMTQSGSCWDQLQDYISVPIGQFTRPSSIRLYSIPFHHLDLHAVGTYGQLY